LKFVLGTHILDTDCRRFPLEAPAELAEPAATIWVFLAGARAYGMPIDQPTRRVIERTYPDFVGLIDSTSRVRTIQLREPTDFEMSTE
jgi:hypothetical protein